MSEMKKPFTHINEQVEILKSRDLSIADEEDSCAKLLRHNYYTVVNGYKYPFLLSKPSENDLYIAGASFDELFSLYTFDCNVRALLLKYILKVEHQLKSVISHYFAKQHPNEKYPEYLAAKNFDVDSTGQITAGKQKDYDTLCDTIRTKVDEQLSKNNEMLTHYKKNYDNIPPWILVSVFSFGMLRTFYCCMSNKDQNAVAKVFGLRLEEMISYISALNRFRNSCAHDERIYNYRLQNRVVRKDKHGNKREYQKVYVLLLILKDMLDAASFMSFYSELNDHIEKLKLDLKSIKIEKILMAMGIPTDEAVRKSELGPLERGNALSDEEFKDVLSRYILPIMPFSAELESLEQDDPNKENQRCSLIELKGNTLYFAQAKNSAFVYCMHLDEVAIKQLQLGEIQEHLASLVDYIHIFWNLSNLSTYGRDKVAIAFPMLCEQAYELTICHLMCKKNSPEEQLKYQEEYEEFKQQIGREQEKEQRQALTQEIQSKHKRVYQLISREGVTEKTLYSILTQIEAWAAKTYEGQKKTFGIVLCTDTFPADVATFDYVDFLKSDYSATINDGIYSAVELYADGTFKEHLTINSSICDQSPSIPYPFGGFANLCTAEKIGILLTDSGDILIINDKKLCYTKHNGHWLRSMADKVIDKIASVLCLDKRQKAEAIYQAIVDVSYSRGGACIGIIKDTALPERLNEMIKAGLLSNAESNNKLLALKTMISTVDHSELRQKSFFELDRSLRRELLELDGAMVLNSDGEIYVIGTIIKLDGSGSDGGGRTAAALQLSEFGLAIKVSQDGYVQLFKNRDTILEIMT